MLALLFLVHRLEVSSNHMFAQLVPEMSFSSESYCTCKIR